MKKSPAITDATRQAFVDAFLQLHKKKPINKISVREIVEITGNNRSTFYRYFEDVYALYDYIQETLFRQISPVVLNNLILTVDNEAFIRHFRALHTKWEAYFDVILSDSIRFGIPEKLRQLATEFLIANLQLPQNNPKTGYLIDCYLAVVLTVLKRWAGSTDPIDIADLALMLRDILSTGIFAQLRELSPVVK